ncbi:hypothetical protein [Dactylosporangium salmoneum]
MRTDLIFDRQTHAFLGTRSIMVRDEDGLKQGDVTNSSAVLAVAIVDRVGQAP